MSRLKLLYINESMRGGDKGEEDTLCNSDFGFNAGF